ncbi:unnamed protein product, partial [Mesorhabditis spiculigera]
MGRWLAMTTALIILGLAMFVIPFVPSLCRNSPSERLRFDVCYVRRCILYRDGYRAVFFRENRPKHWFQPFETQAISVINSDPSVIVPGKDPEPVVFATA